MSDAPAVGVTARAPELLGQTVIVIGGSSGMGFETARRARAEGAEVVLTGRDQSASSRRQARWTQPASPRSMPATRPCSPSSSEPSRCPSIT